MGVESPVICRFLSSIDPHTSGGTKQKGISFHRIHWIHFDVPFASNIQIISVKYGTPYLGKTCSLYCFVFFQYGDLCSLYSQLYQILFWFPPCHMSLEVIFPSSRRTVQLSLFEMTVLSYVVLTEEMDDIFILYRG